MCKGVQVPLLVESVTCERELSSLSHHGELYLALACLQFNMS